MISDLKLCNLEANLVLPKNLPSFFSESIYVWQKPFLQQRYLSHRYSRVAERTHILAPDALLQETKPLLRKQDDRKKKKLHTCITPPWRWLEEGNPGINLSGITTIFAVDVSGGTLGARSHRVREFSCEHNKRGPIEEYLTLPKPPANLWSLWRIWLSGTPHMVLARC